MVTFNDLLSWDGTNLDTAGDALIAASHKYEQVNADLRKDGLGDGLSGKTFEAEAKARRILADDAEDLWTGLSKEGNDLKDASTTVTTICGAANNLAYRIQNDGLSISDTGEITVAQNTGNSNDDTGYTDSLIEGYNSERDRLVEQASDTVTFISSVYDELAKVDDTANGPSPEVVNHGDKPPNPNWTPSQVNDWWTSLTDAQRQHIIDKHPAWIGNVNGIPSSDRHKANMAWLACMQKEMDQQIADFEPKSNKIWYSPPGGGGGYYTETPNPEYEALLKKREELNNISASLNSEESRKAGRTLLVLDNSSGDHFRAAVGSGDIDNADHVMVFTPGMTTQATPGLFGENGSTGSAIQSSENILNESGLAWKPGDKGQETAAAVTWLGYDAPNWSETLRGTDSSVLSSKEAQSAGPDLASFYDGLQETHHGDPHLVAAGHSYGSTATGYALRESNAPDDVVVWGSPGVTSVDASDLGMLPDHMYAVGTGDDMIASSGRYGGDPSSHPESDFTTLLTTKQGPYLHSEWHSSYTDKDTTSLHNISQVMKDQTPSYVDQRSIRSN